MPTPPPPDITTARNLTPADLQWLVCPVCRESLTLTESEIQPELGNIASQTISCTSCTRTYPVADKLPVLLADRAALSK